MEFSGTNHIKNWKKFFPSIFPWCSTKRDDFNVSKEEAEGLFKATEALADEAFEAVLKSLGGKAKDEKESDLFKEKGVSGEGEPKKQEDAGLALVGELIKKSKKQ